MQHGTIVHVCMCNDTCMYMRTYMCVWFVIVFLPPRLVQWCTVSIHLYWTPGLRLICSKSSPECKCMWVVYMYVHVYATRVHVYRVFVFCCSACTFVHVYTCICMYMYISLSRWTSLPMCVWFEHVLIARAGREGVVVSSFIVVHHDDVDYD